MSPLLRELEVGPPPAGVVRSAPAALFVLRSGRCRCLPPPSEPGAHGPERASLPLPPRRRAGNGRGGCSAAWRPRGAGAGICSRCRCFSPRRLAGHPEPPARLEAPRPEARGGGGTLGRGGGGGTVGRGGAAGGWGGWERGLGSCGRDPLGTSLDSGRGGRDPRRGAGRAGGGKTAELSQSQAPQGKAPTDSSIKLLNF